MQKVLAILTINPDYQEFAIPELKALLICTSAPGALQCELQGDKKFPLYCADNTRLRIQKKMYVDVHVEFEEIASRAVMLTKFVLLLAEGKNYEELYQNQNLELLEKECRNWEEEIMCEFTSRNRILERAEQIEKIHSVFQKLDIRGKVSIKTAKKRLQLVELHTWYQEHHKTPTNETLNHVYFGIELGTNLSASKTKFNYPYRLSNRIYLGPTSADNDLAFMMCNQAQVKSGDFVFDPFVGTAGLLIPPATMGAVVFGCDLDMRVLNGYSVGRINKKSEYYSADKSLETFTPKIVLNFNQYGLPIPNILRMDCTKCSFAPHLKFDAIVTDPPYGIRAMSRSLQPKNKEHKQQEKQEQEQQKDKQQEEEQEGGKGKINQEIVKELRVESEDVVEGAIKQEQEGNKEGEESEITEEERKKIELKKAKKVMKKENKKKRREMLTEEEIAFKAEITEKLNRERIDNWNRFDKGVIENTERSVMFDSLLEVARRHLKDGGRLVFLYPIYEEEEFKGVESLPKCEGFDIIDFSENLLSKGNSRILVTLKKKQQLQ